jgi:hypothetical protein
MLLIAAALLAAALVGFLFLYMSPCGVTIEKFQDVPTPVGKKGMVAPAQVPPPPPAPAAARIPWFCDTYGYASPDNSIRLYSEKECLSSLGGIWSPNGECTKKEGGSFSYECRDLNNQAVPVPVQAPQAGFQAIKSMTPPPSVAPTPVAPTPASSAAALTLTPAQCSALCPLTQESCESKFSCQTRLEPIGVAPMTTTSTPAPAK